MEESSSVPQPDSPAPARRDESGATLDLEPLDRSHLLRRSPRYPFPDLVPDDSAIRFRRARRVSGSFRGIRGLARNGGG